ncbi:unnamed protein product [Coffea canephora]|uniref:DH200=94 genomic scaffold, scaffold_733 n=1 Tax=Coffea canephora TaxID=49390 RepID=A0A068VGZ0_COFCA|nr:unnamed protein product [Coffea canephora]
MEALKQEKTSLMAICGMAGVGKTTLVKQITDQVKFEKLFDEDQVAFATVSQSPDMRNVQDQLAEQLGMKITEQTDLPRAERLYRRLTNSGKRILVVLDDIWNELDLKSLGIPVKGECKSLKVILTSRLSDVCRDMGAEIFEVNVLPEKEAWHLFKEVAEISDDSALSGVAKQVAEECKGLPLAIFVVARALKGNHTLQPWDRALRQLRTDRMGNLRGVQNLVFLRIEVMELNNSQIKFPPSWPDQMLRSLRTLCLDYCVLGTGLSSMLGHMTQLETLSLFQSNIDDEKFPAKIAQLSNLNLLDLRVESSLHPLPSGILSSLKKLEELYLGSGENLQLGRDEEEQIGCLEEISSISNLKCLQIILDDLNLLLLSLQEFDTQKLSRFHIAVANYEEAEYLNKKYQFQKSFGLYLSDHGDEGIVKRTENLTLELHISSRLRNLVPDLGEDGFINLKKLDLQDGLELKEICKGFLPPRCFNQLQEVRLYSIGALECLWEGSVEPSSLCNLRSIKMQYCDEITTLFSQSALKCLVKLQRIDVSGCQNLERIVMREEILTEEVLELPQLKALTLNDTNFVVCQIFQVSLPRLEVLYIVDPSDGPEQLVGGKMPSGSLDNLKSVELRGCKSIRCIAKGDTVALLQNLQALLTWDCHGMESLVDFEGLKFHNTLSKKGLEILPKLESLSWQSCPRLIHIWRNFPEGVRVFQNLRSLNVVNCPLKCLFHPPSVATMLISLEELDVRECSKMHEVIGEEDEEVSQKDNTQQHDVGKQREIALGRTSKEFVFPKLSSLQLKALENLRSFDGSHREDYEFKFPLLTELIISYCPKLKKFCSGKLNAPLLKEVQIGPSNTENFEAPVDLKVLIF